MAAAIPHHQPLTHPLPFSTTPRGCRVEDIPDDLVTWDGWSPKDCLNLDPAPPAGWYSIPHWAALTEWHLFNYLEEPGTVICEEWLGDRWQGQALRLAAEEGIAPIEWPAPPKMQAAGIATALLFPDPILREVFDRPACRR